MSLILKKIREDLKAAMTKEVQLRKQDSFSSVDINFVVTQKTVSRAIISMFPEIGKKANNATDDDTIKLLKKYISQEKERNLYQFKYLTEGDVKGKSSSEIKKLVSDTMQELGDKLISPVIEIAQKYLPKEASAEEITVWISENLDLSSYKNKMQAMGPIMKQFKGCDGNVVRSILMKL